MKLNPTKDNQIMKVLKVDDLSHIIADTPKGRLSVKLRKGEYDYKFFLDSVPMDDETNLNLRELYHELF